MHHAAAHPSPARAQVRAAASRTALACGLLALAALAAPGQAQAQQIWKWRDASGHVQISDRAPPPGTPAQDILQRPSGAPVPADAGTAAPAPASGVRIMNNGVDPELAKRKTAEQQQRADAEAKRQQALAKIQADECNRAKANLATYNSGVRISKPAADGSREFLDDAGREAFGQKAQADVAKACK